QPFLQIILSFISLKINCLIILSCTKVEKSFPTSKSDLFAAFIEQCLFLTNKEGLTGYMTPFVWMFISSYEDLRKKIIDNHLIHSLVQLEYSGFDGATVPICTFTLRTQYIENAKGSYIRLEEFKGSQNQGPKTLEAINNPACGWLYIKDQNDFINIPQMSLGFSLSNKAIDIFNDNVKLGDISNVKVGLQTSDNDYFRRNWQEINLNEFNSKWHKFISGGGFRKWYGLGNYVVKWENDGFEIKNFKDENGRLKSRPQNLNYYDKFGITWGKITSAEVSFRIKQEDEIFSDAAMCIFFSDKNKIFQILGLLNSSIFRNILKPITPTLNLQVGDLSKFPVILEHNDKLLDIIYECVRLSKEDWDKGELSWDFKYNSVIHLGSVDLKNSIKYFEKKWKFNYIKLHQNEEKLNCQFIKIYGLENEIDQNLHIGDITILKDELLPRKQKGSKKKSSDFEEEDTKWTPVWENLENQFRANGYEGLELPFNHEEIIKQFISYAVGCMFGRYSLDQEGLILANQGDTLQQYIERVGKQEAELQFVPDQDNVIPVLEGEWFADDIVGRFREFLVAVWGKETLQSNIAYIEEALGKDLRKYFVKDFYNDHVKRYSNRPIYWMFSSPKGAFNALIYMHRYNQDTLNTIVTDYLDQYIEKLKVKKEHLKHLENTGTQKEQTAAKKEIINVDKMLKELEDYHREIIYPMALERININLDDGVLVNYNKFGKAIKAHKDLNSADKKKKVRGYDWINVEEIRD
ncbi:BREX-1 system adenine-specific DNA-methyltransferase PglX, partial [Myroides odoratimimus]|uniref:BREX-1 system adenine-specific DNA-methyltransferase PglX n=1 Tax=Myroides odoratimimus TaxID=76832 RepID=UPI0025757BF7